MKPIRIILLILFTVSFNYANIIKPTLYEKKIANAQTVLLFMKANNISDVKLTLDMMHLPFYKNPFKKESFYALVPISYYSKFKTKKIIISYLKEDKRVFTSAKIKIVSGDYKSETITVSKGKVELSKKNKQRTKKEYAQAMKIYHGKSNQLLWDEDFMLPMDTKVTSPFGTKRVYNGSLKGYHSGTDFKAAVGSPIYAANSGIVKLVQNRFYAGNSIVIDHGQGIFSCYFHLSTMDVKVNQRVTKGEIIGLSGATGRVTGPHLHFSMRLHGVQVDPIHLISILNEMN